MPLSGVQKGAIGQFAFLAAALITGNGELEVYTPVADNEGRDAEVRRHLKRLAAIGIQIKVASALIKNGASRKSYLGIRFLLRPNRIQNDSRLWYFFAVYDSHELRFRDPVFLIRSDIFHRIGRRGKQNGMIWFEIMANLEPYSRDRWTPYRVPIAHLGKYLLKIIDDAPLAMAGTSEALPMDAMLVSRRPVRARQVVRRPRAA
jgi:hypothetical protein